MGAVMSALAAVTAVCGCFNTAFDCIGRCCPNCCGRTKPESTPEGNTTTTNNQSVGNTTTTNNQSVGNTINNQSVGNTTTTNNQSVGNTTTTSNTQSSAGNNQRIIINFPGPATAAPPAAAAPPTTPPTGPPAPSDEGTISLRAPPVEMQVPSGERTTAPRAAPPEPPTATSDERTTSSSAPPVEKSIGVQNVVGGSQFITVGLWGDLNVGHSFKHKGFDGIKTVKVCSSDSGIHSIEVQYTKDGKDAEKVKEGSNDGCAQEQCSYNEEVIVLQHGEYINNVQGYYGPYLEDKRIRSLTFTTNTSRPFGPYGEKVKRDEKNTRFFVTEGRIVGFYGKASSYISAIGFYVLPQLNASGEEEQLIEVGFWGKRTPQSFKHWGYGGIKALKISHGAVIDRIEVEYRNDENRHTEGGLGGGGNARKIVFEDGEYINKVIGYYGKFKEDRDSDEVETINQLTFTTTKTDKNTKKPRVLGPYGNKLETYYGNTFATKFSVKGGRVVGFRGTGGTYISSIGFYILP